jgi:hypothetical protein
VAWQGEDKNPKGGNMTTLHPLWKQVTQDILQGYQYGDFVEHEWLFEQLKIERPKVGTQEQFQKVQFQFLNDVESIKEELLTEHQIYLDNSRGKGYRVVNPNDQSDVAWGKLRKGFRKLFMAAEKALVNVNHNMLSDDARRSNSNKLANLSSLRLLTKRGLRHERESLLQSGNENTVRQQEVSRADLGKTI